MDRAAIRPVGRARGLSRALACSAIAHLAVALAVTPAPRSGAGAHDDVRLTVRLVPRPPPVLSRTLPEAAQSPAAPAAAPVPARARTASRASAVSPAIRSTKAAAAPAAFDPVYYAAAELDAYPRPLHPLPRAGGTDAGPPAFRFELFIDEHGVVTRMTRVAPPAGVAADGGWQALLAATRFEPARRAGRAVRSRVLVSVGAAAAEGAR